MTTISPPSEGIIEFLIPDNPAANLIVGFLILLFAAWFVGLLLSRRKLKSAKKQLLALENVDPLVEAQLAHFIDSSAAEREDRNENDVFTGFIRNRLDEPIAAISAHLKSIFFAGWQEGRLEAGELIRHTAQQLFSWNAVLRATLATFIVIGLLGTLFGLADSLAGLAPIMQNKVATGGAAATNEALQESLLSLLVKLKSAFAPSIWGVGLTILGIAFHSWYMRSSAAPVQETLERLTLTIWISQLYPTRSQALQETLEKSFDAAKKVAKVADKIESGSEDFSKNLEKANSLTRHFSEAALRLDHVSDTIDKAFTDRLVTFSQDFSANVQKLSSFENELKSLYAQMQQESAAFHQTYGDTLNKQNTSLHEIVSSMKSYENAYLEKQDSITTDMKNFVSIATEANKSVSEKNREDTRELSAKLLTELKELRDALHARLHDIQDRFTKLGEPLQGTAATIEGTFQNFDRNIRTIIRDDLIRHFKEQNDQNKSQLDSIQDLNAAIKKLLTLLTENSGTQAAQLAHLNATLGNFTPALTAFGGALGSMSGDMKKVIRTLNEIKNLKPSDFLPDSKKPKLDEVAPKPNEPVVVQVEGSAESILTRSWKWIRSLVMEEKIMAAGSTLPKEPVNAETSAAKKADEVIIVKDADLKMEKEVTATDDKTDSAETSPKKTDEVIVVNDDDLKVELLDNKKHP